MGETYSFVARQYDLRHNDRTQFGGGKLRMYRGDLESLRFNEDGEQLLQGEFSKSELVEDLGKAKTVLGAYGLPDPLVSRMSVDVVRGKTLRSNEFSGVTDPTMRPGGFTPFELLAIAYLRGNKDVLSVAGEVVLDYNSQDKPRENEILFLDHEDF